MRAIDKFNDEITRLNAAEASEEQIVEFLARQDELTGNTIGHEIFLADDASNEEFFITYLRSLGSLSDIKEAIRLLRIKNKDNQCVLLLCVQKDCMTFSEEIVPILRKLVPDHTAELVDVLLETDRATYGIGHYYLSQRGAGTQIAYHQVAYHYPIYLQWLHSIADKDAEGALKILGESATGATSLISAGEPYLQHGVFELLIKLAPVKPTQVLQVLNSVLRYVGRLDEQSIPKQTQLINKFLELLSLLANVDGIDTKLFTEVLHQRVSKLGTFGHHIASRAIPEELKGYFALLHKLLAKDPASLSLLLAKQIPSDWRGYAVPTLSMALFLIPNPDVINEFMLILRALAEIDVAKAILLVPSWHELPEREILKMTAHLGKLGKLEEYLVLLISFAQKDAKSALRLLDSIAWSAIIQEGSYTDALHFAMSLLEVLASEYPDTIARFLSGANIAPHLFALHKDEEVNRRYLAVLARLLSNPGFDLNQLSDLLLTLDRRYHCHYGHILLVKQPKCAAAYMSLMQQLPKDVQLRILRSTRIRTFSSDFPIYSSFLEDLFTAQYDLAKSFFLEFMFSADCSSLDLQFTRRMSKKVPDFAYAILEYVDSKFDRAQQIEILQKILDRKDDFLYKLFHESFGYMEWYPVHNPLHDARQLLNEYKKPSSPSEAARTAAQVTGGSGTTAAAAVTSSKPSTTYDHKGPTTFRLRRIADVSPTDKEEVELALIPVPGSKGNIN